MESPPPRGPGPVILATDVSSLSATIARTESRGPRALRVRREHSILHALRVCLHARHPHRRGALAVAVVKLTPGASDSSDLDAFLDACERELGPVVVRCDADDAEDAAFVASEAHLVAVFANAADDDDARRCPPRLLAALARARRGGAAIVAIGRAAIRAVGPDTTGFDANDASRGRRENEAQTRLVPVVARVAERDAASRRDLSRNRLERKRKRRNGGVSPGRASRGSRAVRGRRPGCHLTRAGRGRRGGGGRRFARAAAAAAETEARVSSARLGCFRRGLQDAFFGV